MSQSHYDRVFFDQSELTNIPDHWNTYVVSGVFYVFANDAPGVESLFMSLLHGKRYVAPSGQIQIRELVVRPYEETQNEQ